MRLCSGFNAHSFRSSFSMPLFLQRYHIKKEISLIEIFDHHKSVKSIANNDFVINSMKEK